MKLHSTHIGKLGDLATRRTFEDSEDDRVLRVIITLDVKDDDPAPEAPDPRQCHETRVEARQRLIRARARSREAAIGPVIDALIEQHLDVKGPKAPRLILERLSFRPATQSDWSRSNPGAGSTRRRSALKAASGGAAGGSLTCLNWPSICLMRSSNLASMPASILTNRS